MNDAMFRREGETVDLVPGGAIRVLQKKKGYRFSIDAILLSAFVCSQMTDDVIDLGTGSGVLCLILAASGRCRKATGIDIQQEMIEMARRSVLMNGLDERIELHAGDVRTPEKLFRPQSFDWVVFNPPYRKIKSGRTNPDEQKAIARHEISGSIDDFLKASVYALRKKGRVSLIYPATRLVDLICRMRTQRIEPKRMMVIHSHRKSEAEFVLVEGIREGREELKVLPPIFIYEEDGGYSDPVSAVLSGRLFFP